jgi:flagellar assembly protein FliH
MSFRARRFADSQVTRPFSWGDEAERVAAAEIDPPRPPAEAPVESSAPASGDHSLATIEREAFASGYAQGERAGFEAGAHRAEAMLRRLAGTIDELTTVRRAMINQTERQLVQLALAIARRIVQREVTVDQDLVLTIARVALDRLGDSSTATIRLNPEDYRAVVAHHGDAWAGVRVRVLADDGVSRGGCKVESDIGFIDASVDAQFEQISRELLGGPELVGIEHVAAPAGRVS